MFVRKRSPQRRGGAENTKDIFIEARELCLIHCGEKIIICFSSASLRLCGERV